MKASLFIHGWQFQKCSHLVPLTVLCYEVVCWCFSAWANFNIFMFWLLWLELVNSFCSLFKCPIFNYSETRYVHCTMYQHTVCRTFVMTQDNFRYRSFRKRESKKRQKERHGKYTDTNWWIGREDVLVQVNRVCSTKRRKKSFYSNKEEKSFYSTFFPFIVSLSLAIAAPQCFSRRPRLSGNNILSLFALLYLWRPGSMATKRVEE